jgi:hypothetical protein
MITENITKPKLRLPQSIADAVAVLNKRHFIVRCFQPFPNACR